MSLVFRVAALTCFLVVALSAFTASVNVLETGWSAVGFALWLAATFDWPRR